MKPGMAKRGMKGASLDQLEKNLEEAFAILNSMGVSNVSALRTIQKFIQGCVSSFSKELSSQLQFLGHLELQFSSSSIQGLHELSYSSVQFH